MCVIAFYIMISKVKSIWRVCPSILIIVHKSDIRDGTAISACLRHLIDRPIFSGLKGFNRAWISKRTRHRGFVMFFFFCNDDWQFFLFPSRSFCRCVDPLWRWHTVGVYRKWLRYSAGQIDEAPSSWRLVNAQSLPSSSTNPRPRARFVPGSCLAPRYFPRLHRPINFSISHDDRLKIFFESRGKPATLMIYFVILFTCK